MSHYPATKPYASLVSLLMAYELDQVHIEDVYYKEPSADDSEYTISFTTFYGKEIYTHKCGADDFLLLRQNTLFKFIKE